MRPAGAIRGKWRRPDGKVESESFHVWSFEGGSPRLSRLRTDHLAPMSKFDYVLTHMRFMVSCKLSSFDGR
jgi:hypothetical protein